MADTNLVRIFRTAKVDHLSRDRSKTTDYEPLCGQKPSVGWRRDFGENPYPGTHICRRCLTLAEDLKERI